MIILVSAASMNMTRVRQAHAATGPPALITGLVILVSVRLGILVSFVNCRCILYGFDNSHDCRIALQSIWCNCNVFLTSLFTVLPFCNAAAPFSPGQPLLSPFIGSCPSLYSSSSWSSGFVYLVLCFLYRLVSYSCSHLLVMESVSAVSFFQLLPLLLYLFLYIRDTVPGYTWYAMCHCHYLGHILSNQFCYLSQ